ncbi:hypothetical protein QR674_12560 [Acinetobacter chinensis]|uniref:Uncharacterized protein n=1 Tax=Acinetobacter chinensis TaxID=2004650 RepID=A0ABU3WIV2_9GAMM|nr:hypothetical protein [Acinetobacter chinensis]MDV2469812.1 hypothetical protein [Acinetobacter chinensis]
MTIEKLIIRLQDPATKKRKLFVSSKQLYRLMQTDVSYKTFVETSISWSRLRENIDYHFNEQHDTYNLSICAVQAILILENSDKSWQIFNELTDLINNGFNRLQGK